jgi:hypothetical protein
MFWVWDPNSIKPMKRYTGATTFAKIMIKWMMNDQMPDDQLYDQMEQMPIRMDHKNAINWGQIKKKKTAKLLWREVWIPGYGALWHTLDIDSFAPCYHRFFLIVHVPSTGMTGIGQCTWGQILSLTALESESNLKAKYRDFRLAQWVWKIFLWSRGTSKRILVSVVCSLMKLHCIQLQVYI